ncbi:hypothetical protein B0H16DRAFT_1465279 [Mycena metata]|uniref:Uncharacterized protein n=1 Tax=Mycena metata TaxID=1033252 RepID=A0AAD7IDJ6_9AGAR|nr:hypothetical protein B0H16DRAFT_1465279 [Mycena metata]
MEDLNLRFQNNILNFDDAAERTSVVLAFRAVAVAMSAQVRGRVVFMNGHKAAAWSPGELGNSKWVANNGHSGRGIPTYLQLRPFLEIETSRVDRGFPSTFSVHGIKSVSMRSLRLSSDPLATYTLIVNGVNSNNLPDWSTLQFGVSSHRLPSPASPEDWTALLPHLIFPHLTELKIYQSGIDPAVFSEFIQRHPTISSVDIDIRESQDVLFQPPVTLPALQTIRLGEGPNHQSFAGLNLTPAQNDLTVHLWYRRDTERARASLETIFRQISALPITTLSLRLGHWVHPSSNRVERATARMLERVTTVHLGLSHPDLGRVRSVLEWLAVLPSLTLVGLFDQRSDDSERETTWTSFVHQVNSALPGVAVHVL